MKLDGRTGVVSSERLDERVAFFLGRPWGRNVCSRPRWLLTFTRHFAAERLAADHAPANRGQFQFRLDLVHMFDPLRAKANRRLGQQEPRAPDVRGPLNYARSTIIATALPPPRQREARPRLRPRRASE